MEQRTDSSSTCLVWLVEDNMDDERLTVRSLGKTSFRPSLMIARDGEEAFDLVNNFTESQRSPDLVLLDLKLPKASGFEVLEVIRANSLLKDTPVVILTSSDEPMDVQKAWDLGANDYVKKPVDYQGYQAAVDSVTRLWLPQAPAPKTLETLKPPMKSSFGLYLC